VITIVSDFIIFLLSYNQIIKFDFSTSGCILNFTVYCEVIFILTQKTFKHFESTWNKLPYTNYIQLVIGK